MCLLVLFAPAPTFLWKMPGGRQRQAKEQREATRRKIPAVVCGFVAFAASLATLIDCELRGLDEVRAVGEALSPTLHCLLTRSHHPVC